MKNQWIGILIVGLSLATAWAIRGQFGHEQGAAWAGGIGGLALVLVSQRKDWYNKMLVVALSSAIGWGAGGMISYGVVVGYGRSTDFLNAGYGLLMLFVIGGLFGLLGGGLTGLTLESARGNKVKWGNLMAEMVAGGLIVYYLLVEQLGFLMTPPRSEAWAICLGAGLAMIWYMARNKFTSSLRVAIFTTIGAGFGFAFGNFLQTLGHVLEIKFNMWNVMEYSIGFFGGTSLAYSVFSSKWPVESEAPVNWESRNAYLFLFLLLPLIIYRENFQYDTILKRLGEIPGAENASLISSIIAPVLLILAFVLIWRTIEKSKFNFVKSDVRNVFIIFLTVYMVLSYIVTGVFAGKLYLNHHLYVVNLMVILYLLKNQSNPFFAELISDIDRKRIVVYFLVVLFLILIVSYVSIHIHGDMGGVQNRFVVG